MNRKGMTTVFICLLAGTIVSIVLMFILLANKEAAVSYSSAVFNLSGRSVLSEYDRELYDRYGLIAFYGNVSEIDEKISSYADYSFKDNPYVSYGKLDVNLRSYGMTDKEIFKNEVAECVKAHEFFIGEEEKERVSVTTGKRVLRNREVIGVLPSSAISDTGFSLTEIKNTIKGLSSIDSIITGGTSEFYCSQYIFHYFTSGQSKTLEDEREVRFFHNEVEYILYGNHSDDENVKAFRDGFMTVRVPLNIIFLENNAAKKAEIKAFVESFNAAIDAATGGAGAPVTELAKPLEEAAVKACWAYIEANNDWNRLKKGYRVPITKTPSTWATDLDSAGENIKEMIKSGSEKINPDENAQIKNPDDDEGLCYDEYLKVFLHFLPEDIKYARMADIIEINLKGTYWGNIRMKDLYTGFKFKVKVNGREHSYDEKY